MSNQVYQSFDEPAIDSSTVRGAQWNYDEEQPSSPDQSNGENRDHRASAKNVPHNGNLNPGFQFRAFRLMAGPYFSESSSSKCMLAFLVLLAFLNSAVRVLFSFLMRDFWNALADQNVDAFYRVLVWFLVALCCLAPINVIYTYQRQLLAIHWREWMTERTLQLYSSNRVYYTLELISDNDIDNPDQRIAEDIKSFTDFSLSFFLILLNSSLDLLAFSVILYLIRPLLFVAVILFAAFGTIATWAIGKKLIWLNFQKLRREADFRFSLVRFRENAESIAFYSGEKLEGQLVGQRFQNVISNMRHVNVAERNLNFFTTFFNYTVWLLPVLVVAPEYFAGNVTLGMVQQSSLAFGHVLDDLSVVVNQFNSLSEFAAGMDRLFSFFNAVQLADHDRNNDSPLMEKLVPPSMENANVADTGNGRLPRTAALPPLSTIDLRQRDTIGEIVSSNNISPEVSAEMNHVALSIHNLSLYTPDYKRELIQKLSVSLRWGQRLLIVGESGVGKSSLLRAIAGLWTAGSGSIERPRDVCFLPQRPYCPLGSLRDQLLYPLLSYVYDENENMGTAPIVLERPRSIQADDQNLLNILREVDLYPVAERAGNGNALLGLDAVADWSHTLSLGEQQRLAFGRILVNRPSLVILDESTSALDVPSETKLYSLLSNMKSSTTRDNASEHNRVMTFISVGHRPSLVAHHDMKLNLNGRGSYFIDSILQ